VHTPNPRPRHAFTLPKQPRARFSAFTLVELLVVTAVIAILLGFLIPALSTSSGRALEGDARNFLAQLENARLMALSKRTKTRVLIATTNDWGSDASWRAYLLTSYDGTSGNWLQQGKLNRLSQATTFDSAAGIVAARSTTTTPVVKAPNVTPTPTPANFTGAYVEFLPNGSTSLDPSATPELVAIQDGFVPTAGSSPTPVRKNQTLRSQLTIDPLTGNAILK
jgi:prepilin-type N-terminal cleavage/methylation domain-containing protein